jgi:hypothetical protein
MRQMNFVIGSSKIQKNTYGNYVLKSPSPYGVTFKKQKFSFTCFSRSKLATQ